MKIVTKLLFGSILVGLVLLAVLDIRKTIESKRVKSSDSLNIKKDSSKVKIDSTSSRDSLKRVYY